MTKKKQTVPLSELIAEIQGALFNDGAMVSKAEVIEILRDSVLPKLESIDRILESIRIESKKTKIGEDVLFL